MTNQYIIIPTLNAINCSNHIYNLQLECSRKSDLSSVPSLSLSDDDCQLLLV